MDKTFAVYGTREVTVTYFNGAGYVTRRDDFPRTLWLEGGSTTRQGSAMLVGVRQGTSDSAGYAVRRYNLPDRDASYIPPGTDWRD